MSTLFAVVFTGSLCILGYLSILPVTADNKLIRYTIIADLGLLLIMLGVFVI